MISDGLARRLFVDQFEIEVDIHPVQVIVRAHTGLSKRRGAIASFGEFAQGEEGVDGEVGGARDSRWGRSSPRNSEGNQDNRRQTWS